MNSGTWFRASALALSALATAAACGPGMGVNARWPATNDRYCRSIASSMCNRCGATNPNCSVDYLKVCFANGVDPNGTAALTQGELERCTADISTADCREMNSGIFPASCYPPAAAPAQAQEPAPQEAAPAEPAVTWQDACFGSVRDICVRCKPSNPDRCAVRAAKACVGGRGATNYSPMAASHVSQCAAAMQSLTCDQANSFPYQVPQGCEALALPVPGR